MMEIEATVAKNIQILAYFLPTWKTVWESNDTPALNRPLKLDIYLELNWKSLQSEQKENISNVYINFTTFL